MKYSQCFLNSILNNFLELFENFQFVDMYFLYLDTFKVFIIIPHPDKYLYIISDLGALEHGQCVYHSLDSSERQIAGPVLPRAGREVPQEQVSL